MKQRTLKEQIERRRRALQRASTAVADAREAMDRLRVEITMELYLRQPSAMPTKAHLIDRLATSGIFTLDGLGNVMTTMRALSKKIDEDDLPAASTDSTINVPRDEYKALLEAVCFLTALEEHGIDRYPEYAEARAEVAATAQEIVE